MKVGNIRFEPGGGHNGSDGTHWAYVTVEMVEHTEGEGNPFVRVDIPVFFDSDTKMGELRDQVTKLAIDALKQSADSLADHDWSNHD